MEQLEKQIVSAAEVARQLGVHPKTIARLIRQQRIPALKVANRWVVERDVAEALRKTYSGKRGRPKSL